MKQQGKWLLFLLYGAAAAGFCMIQYLRYTEDFEEVFPHEHGFTLSEPDELLSIELNSASAAQLTKLPGVSRPLAEQIVAYREELGGFTSIAQLAKVPDMSESLYLELGEYLYLNLPEETEAVTDEILPSETVRAAETETNPPTELYLNLNTASAEELCLLPEIGEVTAACIIAYREQIGGFINRRQLLEVSGIGEATYAVIEGYLYLPVEYPLPTELPAASPTAEPTKPETSPAPTQPAEIPVINLNTAVKEELLLLPGCTEELADAILSLRNEIHVFSDILEIYYAEGMTVELYAQWKNYLTVDDGGDADIYDTT